MSEPIESLIREFRREVRDKLMVANHTSRKGNVLQQCEDFLVEQFVEALSAVQRAQEQGWREIATAPKDGTHVLAWRDSGVGLMRWRERDNDTGGFWDEWHVKRPSVPTHWMPMPPSPKGVD